MVDSNENVALSTALMEFRSYINSSYESGSKIAVRYLKAADDFEVAALQSSSSYEETLSQLYSLMTGAPAFELPSKQWNELIARAILMINDFYHNHEPQRRYCRHIVNCPLSFQGLLTSYEQLMATELKREGTIRTRTGRVKTFFIFLDEHDCKALENISPELFLDYISMLNDKYSSQGKASLLYTLRNFFSYDQFISRMAFDPFPYLTGLHSRKHERLPSFYTPDEIRRVIEAVDRDTPWGKTVYLMMLLASVYGLRSSDIKRLTMEDIDWVGKSMHICQYKTGQTVVLPLIDEVLYALLDYIKNARPQSIYNNVFIRLRKPYVPYSIKDHFGDKVNIYFKKAGVCTEGKHHGLHSMRHSLATHLLADEVPVNEISSILGHSSIASTKAYVWSDIEALRSAALEVPYHD